tara:strand:- start:44 stop:304 length:261 start_codon:yes stop_codon:yes gene_type:complete
MTKDNKDKFEGLLTKKQQEELQGMINDMLDIASDLSKEYDDLDVSELNEISGSITQINENSPFLDEIFKGDSWKKVIKKSDDKDVD